MAFLRVFGNTFITSGQKEESIPSDKDLEIQMLHKLKKYEVLKVSDECLKYLQYIKNKGWCEDYNEFEVAIYNLYIVPTVETSWMVCRIIYKIIEHCKKNITFPTEEEKECVEQLMYFIVYLIKTYKFENYGSLDD